MTEDWPGRGSGTEGQRCSPRSLCQLLLAVSGGSAVVLAVFASSCWLSLAEVLSNS